MLKITKLRDNKNSISPSEKQALQPIRETNNSAEEKQTIIGTSGTEILITDKEKNTHLNKNKYLGICSCPRTSVIRPGQDSRLQ